MSAMRTSAVPTADADLIRLAREGDADAYGLLYERHVGAATALARQISRNDADADDLVADAFARVLVAIRNGNGPTDAFRPYLLTAVRRRAYDRTDRAAREELVQEPAEDRTFAELVADLAETDHVDRDLATTAFLTLPERWQAVLWHLEVEGASPAEAGELLGLNANATSVLAHRAREGLRQAFLQAHLQDAPDDGCAFTLERLGAYVRDGLAKRATQKVHDHLEVCARCTGLRGELSDLNTTLRRTVAPAILGPAAAGYFLARRGASAEAATAAAHAGRHELAKTVGTIAASAAAVLLLGAAVFQINRDDPPSTDPAASPATELVADAREDDRVDASTPVDLEGEGDGEGSGPEEAPLPEIALPGVALLCGEQVEAGSVVLPPDDAGDVSGAALVWNDDATARSGLDLPATTQLVTDAVDGTLAGAFSFVTDVTAAVEEGACGVATLIEALPEAGIGQWVLVLATDAVVDVVDAAVDLVQGTVDEADAVVEGLTGLTVTDTLADGVLEPAVAAVARAAAALEALGAAAGSASAPGTGGSGSGAGSTGSSGSGGSGSTGSGGTGGSTPAPTTPTVPDDGGLLGPILDPLLPGDGGGGGGGGGETCGLLGQLLGTC